MVLAVQSLPFLAAVALGAARRHRASTSSRYWQRVRGQGAAVLARRRARAAQRRPRSCEPASRDGKQRSRPAVLAVERAAGCQPITLRRSAVSTSFTQYDVPTGITSSLKS